MYEPGDCVIAIQDVTVEVNDRTVRFTAGQLLAVSGLWPGYVRVTAGGDGGAWLPERLVRVKT